MRNNFLVLLGVSFAAVCVWYFSNIFLYIIIAAVLSLIGQPLGRFLCNIKVGRFKISDTIAATLTYFSLVFVFVLLAMIFVPLIAEEAEILSSIDQNTAMAALQEPLQDVERILQNLHVNYTIYDLQAYLQEKITSILTVTNISIFFNQFIAALGNFFVAFFAISFITFFFLRDEKKITEGIISAMPEQYSEKVKNVLEQSQYMLKRYFIGILIEMLLVITFLSIGLSIAGIKHALLIALFAGIVNAIPYVGPLIGAGFALFIGITTNTDMTMIGVVTKILIVFPIVNLADAFLLQPLIYSNSVKAHPLEIFLVILIGATVGGIGGMLLAVPSYTILRVIAREFFINFRIVQELTKKFDEKK